MCEASGNGLRLCHVLDIMKAYVEIRIHLNPNDRETLHDALGHFTRDTNHWIFPKKESETYQEHTGSEAGYVICDAVDGHESALVAIASQQPKLPNIFYVPNIVPRNCFLLTVEQYNAIGLAFASDFGNWLRACSLKGNVHCSNPEKTLTDIITAEKCRRFFERYLNCPSWNPSSIRIHPSDIEKLDVFICALIRYGAKVSLDEIEKYLIEDQKWKTTDAAWVRNRIEIGLDVLKVDRRF